MGFRANSPFRRAENVSPRPYGQDTTDHGWPEATAETQTMRTRPWQLSPSIYLGTAVPNSTLGVSMRYLSLTEAAEELGVSSKTVRRRIADGSLTARRAGPRLIRIAQSDLDKMMAPVG